MEVEAQAAVVALALALVLVQVLARVLARVPAQALEGRLGPRGAGETAVSCSPALDRRRPSDPGYSSNYTWLSTAQSYYQDRYYK